MVCLVICAFGQPSFVPQNVNIGAPIGSTSPVTQTISLVTSGASGANQPFDLSIRYLTPSVGWLTATPSNGTAPGLIAVTADPTSLTAGTYSAQVVATVGPLHLGAVATVSFTVAPVGSSTGGLSVSPSSLTFLSTSVTPQILTVSNAAGLQGAIRFSCYATSPGWLAITQSDQATPGTITVQAYPAGLASGVYSASITVTAADTGKSVVVPISLVIPSGGLSQSAVLTPGQRALTFNYQLNTSSNPVQTVYVGTNSTSYVYFSAAGSDPWLGVAPASWMSPASTATGFAPGLLYVAVNPTGLGAGTYKGRVTLSSAGLSSVDIPVTLNVSADPVLNANPSFVSLDANLSTLNSNLAVTGSSNFYFTATVAPGSSWLTVSPNVGITGTNPQDLTVTANVTGLPPGVYNGNITLAGPSGVPTLIIPVELKANGSAVTNPLQVSPTTLAFSATVGDSPPTAYLSVVSALAAEQGFAAAAVADGGWLSVAPSSGATPAWPKVSASTSIAPGLYTGSIVVTSLVTGDQSTVSITYKLAARSLTATPSLLAFSQESTGAAIKPQEVQVTANAVSSFRIASQPSWIKIQPASGLTTPVKLAVSVDPAGIAPGQYTANITLSGPNDVVIPVSLTIPEPPPPTVTPGSLSFTYEIGSPAPASQTIQIANPSGPATFAVSISTENGANWLAATPAAGATPGTVTLSVNAAHLVPGTTSATLSVAVSSTTVKTLSVPVTLVVTGSAIQVKSVLNAATMAPSRVAPGEIVSITGIGLGPDAPAVGRPIPAGAFGTTLAGMQVLFDGIPAPLLYVQNEQINAIVPYGIYGRTTTQLQVKSDSSYSVPISLNVADSAPGIFTLSSLGRGQAAALNGDFTANSALNSASTGTVVAVYLTGEGQTDPPGQDGRIITSDLRKPVLPVTAKIGGQPAEVLYAGSSPMQVSGLCQVNVRIPAGLPPGTNSLEIQVGGISSQAGVTLEIH